LTNGILVMAITSNGHLWVYKLKPVDQINLIYIFSNPLAPY